MDKKVKVIKKDKESIPSANFEITESNGELILDENKKKKRCFGEIHNL